MIESPHSTRNMFEEEKSMNGGNVLYEASSLGPDAEYEKHINAVMEEVKSISQREEQWLSVPQPKTTVVP